MALPAPTSATLTTDYIPAGKSRFIFVPTMVNPASPTSAEITAGTDYTNAITARAGFDVTAAEVDNASYASVYGTTIPGVQSSSSSSWTMKADVLGADARTALTLNTAGYVVNALGGLGTGTKIEVWPVRISASNADTVARDALATITVMFAIPQPPVLNIATPTA